MPKNRKNSPTKGKKALKEPEALFGVPAPEGGTQPAREPDTEASPTPEPTKTDKSGSLEVIVPEVVGEEENRQQERTRIGKQMFLEAMRASFGNIKKACEVVDIHRSTFYDWRNGDADFRKALEQIDGELVEDAEGVLGALIRSGDGPSVRFFLQSRSEKYKPKSRLEMVGSLEERTFEDVVDELAVQLSLKPANHANGSHNERHTPEAAGEPAADTGQAQGDGAVQAPASAAPVLGESPKA